MQQLFQVVLLRRLGSDADRQCAGDLLSVSDIDAFPGNAFAEPLGDLKCLFRPGFR
jgi:hypothetical protein